MYDLFTFILKEFGRPWNEQQPPVSAASIHINHDPNYYYAHDSCTQLHAINNLILQQRLSFLEVGDDSFLTPWSRCSNPKSLTSNTRRYMSFQPGSFFSHQPTAAIEPPHHAHHPADAVAVAVAVPGGQPKFEDPEGKLDGDQDESESEIIIYKAKYLREIN